MKIISEIYQSGRYLDSAVFTEEELNFYEKKLGTLFPKDYRVLLLSVDPDIPDFFFTIPERHPSLKNYILIAKYKEYDIAFDRKHNMKVVYLLEDQKVEIYENFLIWFEQFWEKAKK
ncbi:MAG: hypothetical protein NZ853_03040 [Leptospiraceae bacterium]|nr:hypothetical protein [Leptospiraceae bacterium]MDW7975150.1 hypothetical protein [Leptospiraceae bacterium]